MMSLTFGLFTQVSGSGPFRPSCFFDLSEYGQGMIFFRICRGGLENCKMSGKSQGILKWMISGNPLYVPACVFLDLPRL